MRKCPVHGTKTHSLVLELVPLCPNEREFIHCFGRLAATDTAGNDQWYGLNSRSSPLQFKHTKSNASMPLGSFEHVIGKARFLHSGSHYHLKARLYFSSPFREGSLNGDPARHTIYVKKLVGQKLCLKVRPGDTVLSVKQKIRDKDNIPVAQQRLIFRGTQLVDGKRLYESNIFDCATVHLVLRHAPA